MGTYDASDDGLRQRQRLTVPHFFAFYNEFLQHGIVNAGITEQVRHIKVDTACFFDFLHQGQIALFGTACFTDDSDFTV